MRVLIACECSQVVCKAFRDKGHEAYSCDLLPTEGNPDWHIQENVLKHLADGWDMMIAHPPCTYLSAVSAQWLKKDKSRLLLLKKGKEFFLSLLNAEQIPKRCIENPVPLKVANLPKYTQIIHPYYFGDDALKRTCLWLRGLPRLEYTLEANNMFYKQTAVEHPKPLYYLSTNGKPIYFVEGSSGWKARSKFWVSIAQAMAKQWG